MHELGDWLLVDAGNSNIKWASVPAKSGPEALDLVSIRSLPVADGDGLRDVLWCLPRPAAVFLSSVSSSSIFNQLDAIVREKWGISVYRACVEDAGDAPFTAYQPLQNLGVDRWLGMQALWQTVRDNACLVSCGTAITLDVLDGNGRHLGGQIAPGLATMGLALGRGTVQVPAVSDIRRAPLLGLGTEACVQAGIIAAACGMIETTVKRLAQQMDWRGPLILTGGAAEIISQGLDIPHRLIPNMVLRGLLLKAPDYLQETSA